MRAGAHRSDGADGSGSAAAGEGEREVAGSIGEELGVREAGIGEFGGNGVDRFFQTVPFRVDRIAHHKAAGDAKAFVVDNQRFASGGPNLMDPPLHYAPTPLIESIEIDRGAAEDGGLGGALATIESSSSDPKNSGPSSTPVGWVSTMV